MIQKRYFILLIIFYLTICNIFSPVYAMDISQLNDDAVLVSVGNFDITLADFKFYIAGFGSVTDINSAHANGVLQLMIVDTLFKAACFDEKITISENELKSYTKKFFDDHSLNLENKKSYDLYFYMNDPYSSLQDFYVKSSFYLLKAKYLAKKNLIKSVFTRHIFFSTKGLDKKQKKQKKQLAIKITNQLSSGMGNFKDFLKKYSDDKNSINNYGIFMVIDRSKKVQNIIGSKNVERILLAGLFSPVFIETKNGYHIVENYDYKMKSNLALIDLIDELKKKYHVTQYVFFNKK